LEEEDRLSRLVEVGKRAVKKALRIGADEAEAYLSKSFSTFVGIERGKTLKNGKTMDEGLGIRIVHGKSMGFSYTNALDEESIKKVVLSALQGAKAGRPDEDWRGFSSSGKLSTTRDTFDKRLVDFAIPEAVGIAGRMLDAATNLDNRVLPVEGAAAVQELSKAIVNSSGVDVYDRGTSIDCVLSVMAKEGTSVTPVCLEFESRRTYNINPESVGLRTAKLAVDALNAEPVETGNYAVILSQLALLDLFIHVLIPSLKADHVQRRRSMLRGKVGEKVASGLFSIHDDGLLEGGLATWRFDDEGTPSQKTIIIEKGMLKNYLYDMYTAGKDGVDSTGNACRVSAVPYASTPIVDATNFIVAESTWTPEKLIGEVSKGLFIHTLQGAHSSNPESGEFSVIATPAWRIENGETTKAVKGAMLSGTIFDLMKNISGVGNNVQRSGFLVAPWVRVDNLRVIGR